MKVGVFSGFLISVSYRSNTGKERKKKSRENRWKIANFDNFCPTAVFFTPKVAFWKAWMKTKVFGNQIKEEKLEIFISVPYRSNKGKGKERIWQRYRQTEEKLDNLSDFQQIQAKFYQLENLKKKLPKLSFVWRERGRKEETSCFAKNSQKVTKSAKKIGKRCSSQKPSNFVARDERPRESERFEPQQGILWQIWPKSPKKCQMRKFPEKKIFSKFQKRSKKVEKMILSPMEVVSEGGNREKVAKKEKLKKILRFQRP